MLRNAAGHRFNMRFATKKYCESTGLLKHRAIEFQPSRRAAARQHSVGGYDVGIGAGARQLRPVDSVAAADCQQAPGATVNGYVGNTGVAAATGEALLVEIHRIAIVR